MFPRIISCLTNPSGRIFESAILALLIRRWKRQHKRLTATISFYSFHRATKRGAGDAGDRLSGGERQRITIARAMLKKSSVVILDEATAYADPESEAQIQQAVGRLVQGKTLIVVAPPSVLQSAAPGRSLW